MLADLIAALPSLSTFVSQGAPAIVGLGFTGLACLYIRHIKRQFDAKRGHPAE